jgi:hypothetical protein
VQGRLSSVTPRFVHPSLRLPLVGVAILLGGTVVPAPGMLIRAGLRLLPLTSLNRLMRH